MSTTLGDRIRSQAAIADRPGQMRALEEIAEEVERLERWQPSGRDQAVLRVCRGAARDYLNGRPREDAMDEILLVLLDDAGGGAA